MRRGQQAGGCGFPTRRRAENGSFARQSLAEERAAQGAAPTGTFTGGPSPRRHAAGRHPAIKRLVALRI